MGRKRCLRCVECHELINFEDLADCERCSVSLHEWCVMLSLIS